MADKDPSDRRRRLDSVIPEILKRAVEIGVEKAVEAPNDLRELVAGMKLPKDIAHLVLAQAEETKNGLFRVVAKEIREFLEHTNLAGEMQKLLTTLQFEVNTTIRFKPNDEKAEPGEPAKLPKPEVKADVQMKRAPQAAGSGPPQAGGSGPLPRTGRRTRD